MWSHWAKVVTGVFHREQEATLWTFGGPFRSFGLPFWSLTAFFNPFLFFGREQSIIVSGRFCPLRFCNTAIESATIDKEVATLKQVTTKDQQVGFAFIGLEGSWFKPDKLKPGTFCFHHRQRSLNDKAASGFQMGLLWIYYHLRIFFGQVQSLRQIFRQIDRANANEVSFQARSQFQSVMQIKERTHQFSCGRAVLRAKYFKVGLNPVIM